MVVSPADDAEDPPAGPGVDADVTDRLRTASLEPLGRFATASNATLLVRLRDPDDPPLAAGASWRDLPPAALGVYKPRQGEAPLWDFPEGTLYRREVAAYEVDRLLGWNLVPVTVVRADAPFGVGALQQYVPHDPDLHYFALLQDADASIAVQLEQMVLFDVVIDNADRKASHVLLEGDRIRLVDHGVSFNVDHKLRTVAWDFAGEEVPGHLRDDVADLAALLAIRDERTRSLRDLLAPDEYGALLARAEDAAAREVFPEPLGPRPYPWPLV